MAKKATIGTAESVAWCTVQQTPRAPQTKIRKLKEHVARPDTLRAKLLDLLMDSKTLGEAYAKHCEFCGRTCYVSSVDVRYAKKCGYISE